MSAPGNTDRKCVRCCTTKPGSDFYVSNLSACKECVKAAVRANYAANRNYYVEYDKRRERTEPRKVFKSNARKKHRAENPLKYQARLAVSNALRDGRLVRLPCERCGATERVHGHHHDYSQPLDVEWLCKDCHWAHHRAEKRAG